MKRSLHPVSGAVGKWTLHSIVLIAGSAILGTLLLLLVALIPQDALYENVLESADVLREEGDYPSVFSGSRGGQLDNCTDALMLNTAYTSTGSVLDDALLGTRMDYDEEGMTTVGDLYKYLYEDDGSSYVYTYGRYWHGYQVILKPLLAVMSLPHIRALNMFLQLSLMFLLFSLLMKRGGVCLCVPLFVTWVCLCPAALFLSLQFSTVFYPTMLTAIALVYGHDRLSPMKRCLLFELCGIVVAYIDVLTYPLVALGVPLILFLALDYHANRTFGERFLQVFSCSLSWVLGYGLMWASKWVIASALTGQNVIEDALGAVGTRASHTVGSTSYSLLDAVSSNLVYLEAVAPVAAVLAAVLFYLAWRRKHREIRLHVPALLAILTVSLFPFAWYLVVMNHSIVHCWFAYRELAILVCGILTLLFVPLVPEHAAGDSA